MHQSAPGHTTMAVHGAFLFPEVRWASTLPVKKEGKKEGGGRHRYAKGSRLLYFGRQASPSEAQGLCVLFCLYFGSQVKR